VERERAVRDDDGGREADRERARRRWGRAMTNGMRAGGACKTGLEPALPEKTRARVSGGGGSSGRGGWRRR